MRRRRWGLIGRNCFRSRRYRMGGWYAVSHHTNVPDTFSSVPIIGVETHGSACFYHSVHATRGDESQLPPGTTVKEVTAPDALQAYSVKRSTRRDEGIEDRTVRVAHLASLSSRATSLGASSPSPSAVQMAVHRKGGVRCLTVSDERAMEAALRFAGMRHHKVLAH